MKATDAAWAAGIVDGEGTIGFYRQSQVRAPGRRSYFLSVTVGNTDLRMLERLSQLFGAKIYSMNHSQPNQRRKPMYQWMIRGPRAVAMLRAIQPYLVTKGEQARLVLTYRPGHPGLVVTDEELAGREELRARMRVLNRRGIAS